MNDKDKNRHYDLMQDTQFLLQGLEESDDESYDLKDILAEFGSEDDVDLYAAEPEMEKEPEKGSEKENAPAPQPEKTPEQPLHPNVIAFPAAAAVREEEDAEDTLVVIDMREYEEEEELSADELFGLHTEREREEPRREDGEPEEGEPHAEQEERPLTMEDIVASTVDAVKAEREKKQSELRRRIEKERKKREAKQPKVRVKTQVPEVEDEQSPKEAAVFHKRRYIVCRRNLLLSLPVLVLMWLPWLLTEAGIVLPYFSAGTENAAVCILAAHMLLCILCAPLFRAAVEELKERSCTFYTYSALTNLAALLDEVTFLALPGRTAAVPIGSVSGCALVFALWGLRNYHRGMFETFRTAAMGEPSVVADCGTGGISKGLGRIAGFVTRANMESTASQWQRMVLPVLTTASVVFALLSSVGQGRGQDFLWCWSVILAASCALTCPLSFCVPYGRVARRLSRSGTAVAGQYGAEALSASQKLVVTDMDLFPRTTVSLGGIKLYGEERNHAISYTATLVTQGGGCLAQVFENVCRGEHIPYQPLEHFHIHDDNGLSGMIRGETVLVGTPVFMRHRGVRLPATLPTKTAVCLAVDGELAAVFAVKYSVNPPVEIAMRSLARNSLQLVLATRDGNVIPKMIRARFGTDGKAEIPEISERLSLSDPMREAGAPSGLIYRDGLLPFVELVALSRRLCQMARVGNLLSMLGGVFGALLAFYLTFVGSTDVLTPILLMTYLLLWVVPMVPLLMGVDRL